MSDQRGRRVFLMGWRFWHGARAPGTTGHTGRFLFCVICFFSLYCSASPFLLLIVLFWIYCGRIYHCTCTTRGGIMGGLDTRAGGEVLTYLSSGAAYSFLSGCWDICCLSPAVSISVCSCFASADLSLWRTSLTFVVILFSVCQCLLHHRRALLFHSVVFSIPPCCCISLAVEISAASRGWE